MADPVSPEHPSAAVHQAVVHVIKKVATMAERPVALGMLRGQTHREIAADLGITPKAVEHRLASLRRKAWIHRPLTRRDDTSLVEPPGLRDRLLDPDGLSEDLWDWIWGDGGTAT